MVRLLSLLLVACAALYGGIALVWAVANLGDVPHYGDSLEYLFLARTLEVDAYRGIAYPAFLALADRVLGEPSILQPIARWHESGPCPVSPSFVGLQLVQVAAALPALAYFVHVFGGRTRRRLVAFAGLVLVLALDPLVLHFNTSVMTDGLALSGSLVFCAALADLRRCLARRPGFSWRAVLAASAFAGSFLVTAGLRADKNLICSATTLVTLAVWWLLARGRPRAGLGRASAVLGGLALASFVTVVLVQRAYHRDQGRWRPVTSVLQQRIVFPNVVATYDRLPPWIRARISPAAARYFDEHHRHGREVIDQVTGGDAAERERMVAEMAAVAWHERWGRITADALRDALENVFATLSFYARLATYAVRGEEGFKALFYSDGTRWTYTRLALHHPRLSRVYLAASGALLLLASAVALLRWRARRRAGGGRWSRETAAHYAPLVVFVVLNAGLFAALSDLVHVRYTVLAHVAFLLLVFGGALAPAEPAQRST